MPMPNKLPKFFDHYRICVICEGNEEYEYLKRLSDLKVWNILAPIVGYIGSNGAGKSTTIKMMTGILTPTRGECLVNGVNPSKNRKENAQNIGVVFGQRT